MIETERKEFFIVMKHITQEMVYIINTSLIEEKDKEYISLALNDVLDILCNDSKKKKIKFAAAEINYLKKPDTEKTRNILSKTYYSTIELLSSAVEKSLKEIERKPQEIDTIRYKLGV